MFFQECRFCPPPCSISTVGLEAAVTVSGVPFVGNQGEVIDAAERYGLGFAVCDAHGYPRRPAAHVRHDRPAPAGVGSGVYRSPEIFGGRSQRHQRDPAPRSATASWRPPSDCLSEPHEGPVHVSAILARADAPAARSTGTFELQGRSRSSRCSSRSPSGWPCCSTRSPAPRPPDPVDKLRAWLDQMFTLASDTDLHRYLAVLDCDEMRSAKGYSGGARAVASAPGGLAGSDSGERAVPRGRSRWPSLDSRCDRRSRPW